MENQEQENTKPKATLENPKPTDDVQLTIETVIPDTACTTVPQTPVESEQLEEKVEGANDNNSAGVDGEPSGAGAVDEQKQEDKQEDSAAQPATAEKEPVEGLDEQKAEESAEAETEVADENDAADERKTAETKEGDNNEGDDERDKIETVAP